MSRRPVPPRRQYQRRDGSAIRCRRPILRFTPYAWAKFHWFRDRGPTEIGGFGVGAEDDLVLIQDFITVEQQVTAVSVEFDDDAVADFFDGQVDEGRRPEQFARVWLHSHPGNNSRPSGTDEETFERVFGNCDWSVMAIVARGGQTYGRLQMNTGPGIACRVGFDVAYGMPFPASDEPAWEAEYIRNVHAVDHILPDPGALARGPHENGWLGELELSPDAIAVLDELDTVSHTARSP